MSEVTLPALGESVTEGTITRWLKNVGDTVAVDEPLVEVSTDKVDTERSLLPSQELLSKLWSKKTKRSPLALFLQ